MSPSQPTPTAPVPPPAPLTPPPVTNPTQPSPSGPPEPPPAGPAEPPAEPGKPRQGRAAADASPRRADFDAVGALPSWALAPPAVASPAPVAASPRRAVVPSADLDAAVDASLSRPRAEPVAALQLRRVPLAGLGRPVERDPDDLPSPKPDDAPRPRGVWMIADDDDRFTRRSGRDDLWSLQRAHRRLPVQPTL